MHQIRHVFLFTWAPRLVSIVRVDQNWSALTVKLPCILLFVDVFAIDVLQHSKIFLLQMQPRNLKTKVLFYAMFVTIPFPKLWSKREMLFSDDHWGVSHKKIIYLKDECLYIHNNICSFLFVSAVIFKQDDRINKTLEKEVSWCHYDFV